MAKKNILITGGAGFVGSHLADALLRAGHNVCVFDNLTPQVHPFGLPDYLDPEVEFLRGDMRDHEAVRRAVKGADVIFHYAARVGVGQSMYEIEDYVGENTFGTAVLLQVLLDMKIPIEKLIVASSMSIYGEGKYACCNCGDVAPVPRSITQLKAKQWEMRCPSCAEQLSPLPTREDKPLQATSFYALSKKDQEEMCLLFGRTYSLPVVALRYFNIYGTRQALSNPYTGVAAIFGSRLLNDRAPLLFEDGLQMRDFVSVYDIVQANLLAMEKSTADGRAINIGSGSPVSIHDVAQTLARQLGKNVHCETTGQYRVGDIRHCFADITAARTSLGYQPKYSFTQGVAELVHWLRLQNADDRAAVMLQQLKMFGLSA